MVQKIVGAFTRKIPLISLIEVKAIYTNICCNKPFLKVWVWVICFVTFSILLLDNPVDLTTFFPNALTRQSHLT